MIRILADENVHSKIVRGLRKTGYEALFVPEIGFAGKEDQTILEYSEKHNMIPLSGDKDFGGLIEFGTLWGRGKVILLRYHLINITRIVKNISEILVNVINKAPEVTAANVHSARCVQHALLSYRIGKRSGRADR